MVKEPEWGDGIRQVLRKLPGAWDVSIDLEYGSFAVCRFLRAEDHLTSRAAITQALKAARLLRRFAGPYPGHVGVQDSTGKWHIAVSAPLLEPPRD